MAVPKPRITLNKGWESDFICQSLEQLHEGKLHVIGYGNSYKEAYRDWLVEYNNWRESEKQENKQ